MIKQIFLLFFLLISIEIHAQYFAGLGTDPNSGIYALNLQPAQLWNSTHKWQLTALGVDFSFTTQNLSENVNILNSTYKIDARKLFELNDNTTQIFAQVILPGIIYAPNNKHQFGFSLNLRSYGYSDYNQPSLLKFFEGLIEGGKWPEGFTINQGYSKAFLNTWLEAKFNYTRVLYKQGKHKVNGGAAIKFLGGAASGYFEMQDLQATISRNNVDEINTLVKYVYNTGLDELNESNSLKINLFDRSSIGFDFAAQYYFYDRPEDELTNDYRFSVGFNVLDVGSIKYQSSRNSLEFNVQGQNVSLNFIGEVNSFEELADSLASNFEVSSFEQNDYRLSLPTRYSLAIDYRALRNFWISAIPTLWPVNDRIFLRDSNIFNVLITPRYRWKKLTLYLPINVSNSVKNLYGFSLRYGVLSVGSSNLWNIAVEGKGTKFFNVFLNASFKIKKKE